MAISSEFYKDLSKVEKKIWGITVREFKAYVCFVFIGILLLLEVFFLPDLLFMVCALVTSFALGWYPVLLMMNKWKEVKRAFYLRFYYEERTFQTGKIRRYQKDEFVQKETIKETDVI